MREAKIGGRRKRGKKEQFEVKDKVKRRVVNDKGRLDKTEKRYLKTRRSVVNKNRTLLSGCLVLKG
jgi:hypothetical protein